MVYGLRVYHVGTDVLLHMVPHDPCCTYPWLHAFSSSNIKRFIRSIGGPVGASTVFSSLSAVSWGLKIFSTNVAMLFETTSNHVSCVVFMLKPSQNVVEIQRTGLPPYTVSSFAIACEQWGSQSHTYHLSQIIIEKRLVNQA